MTTRENATILSELISSGEAAIASDDYEGASSYLEKASELLKGDPQQADIWLKQLCSKALLGRVNECRSLIQSYSLERAPSAKRAYDVGAAVVNVLDTGELFPLRSSVERFSQGFMKFDETIWPKIFSLIETRRFSATKVTDSPHDYSITSYSLWQQGLRNTAEEQHLKALECLMKSIERYQIGEMHGDVLWSRYDVVICHLFLRNLDEAKRYYGELLEPAAPNRFQRMAEGMIRAYEQNSLKDVMAVEQTMKSQCGNLYYDTWYPTIFLSFEQMVSVAAKEGTKETKTTIKPTRGQGSIDDGVSYFIARPAKNAASEVDALQKIAKEINLGNTRPSTIQGHIDTSCETISGSTNWSQGLLLLVTELFPSDGEPIVVGSSKLQYMVRGCWVKKRKTTVASNKLYISPKDWLRYDNADLEAVELAGNAVLKEYQDKGLGWFHTQARFLYILLHGVGGFKYVLADLLTSSDRGMYPFYEYILKPMIARQTAADHAIEYLPYDDADRKRYEDPAFFADLLSSKESGPFTFPIVITRPELHSGLGEVRSETKAAEAVLVRYGFKTTSHFYPDSCDRFDLLDGGPYYGMSIEELCRSLKNKYVKTLPVYPLGVSDQLTRTEDVTFSPNRTQMEFICIRCRGRIDSDNLQIPPEIFNKLGFRKGDLVTVIAKPEKTAPK